MDERVEARVDIAKPDAKFSIYANPTQLLKPTHVLYGNKKYFFTLMKEDLIDATIYTEGGSKLGDRNAILQDFKNKFVAEQIFHLRQLPHQELHPCFRGIKFRRLDDNGNYHMLSMDDQIKAITEIVDVASTNMLDDPTLKNTVHLKEAIVQ